jgi:acyl-CoA dehydrogenase-like protein
VRSRRIAPRRCTRRRTCCTATDVLVGSPGTAERVVTRTLLTAAVGLGAEQVGGIRRCLEMAVEYAKLRTQFNRPIGGFQAGWAGRTVAGSLLTAIHLAKEKRAPSLCERDLRGAGEAACYRRAAVAGVACELRVQAEWPGVGHHARCGIYGCAEDGCGCLPVLDPVDEGIEGLGRLGRRGTCGARAVLRAGCQEQPGEGVGRLGSARRLLDPLVVVDRSLREDELIGEAVPDDD